MPNFKTMIEGMKAKEEPQAQTEQHQVTEAKVPEGRFLKDDPYYKLVADKKPKAYREHLFYPEGDKLALHGTAGERLGEFANEDEVKKFVDAKYDQPKPKKTVGEELREFYEKEFFKRANGDKEDFVNQFINRFGISKGSSRKEMEEFYGKRFDELSAKQNQPKAQQPKQGSFERAIRDIGDDED